jgi:DNA-binding response OmpR family regulator
LGNLSIDAEAFEVLVGQRRVDLTYCEFQLLSALAKNRDRTVPYDVLCEALWSSGGPKQRRRLNVTICRLRAKLAGAFPYRVETVRNRGYGLVA